MNLIYSCTGDRNSYNELKDVLDSNKIKYAVDDDDAFRLKFKVSKDSVNDFQMNIANVTCGRISGNFEIES
jgi:hypothetical protein